MKWAFITILAGVLTLGVFGALAVYIDYSAGKAEIQVVNEDFPQGPWFDNWVLPADTALPPQIDLNDLKTPLITISDHDNCTPITFPIPEYPDIHQNLEANCNVIFYIDEYGAPIDIEVTCTEPEFEMTTKVAISNMRWRVTNEYGAKCRYIGRTDYPIEYRLAD